MKIGYVYPFEAFPPKGGNQLHAYQLAKRFLEGGHRVLTFGDTTVPGADAVARSAAGASRLVGAADVLYLRVDGNHLRNAPFVTGLLRDTDAPVVWEINAPADERLAFSWLGGDRSPRTAAGRLVDRVRRALHAGRQAPAIRAEERLRRRLARRAAAAVCVSAAVGCYARAELGMDVVEVLPNGSDHELNHPGREPSPLPPRFRDHLKVLFAGSPIYPWQGLDVLLEAARLSRGSGDPILFLLLLNQPLRESAPENVTVLESVPYADVARHICAADVCVTLQPDFPWSRWGFHGSPMKLFDYMACGKPIVASAPGQPGELLRLHRNGLLCDRTGQDLLQKLRYLARHPEEASEMGRRSRQAVVDLYNWDRIAERTLTLFEAVVGAVGRGSVGGA